MSDQTTEATPKGHGTVSWRSRGLIAGLVVAAVAASFALDGPIYRLVHDHYNIHTRPVPSALRTVTRLLRSLEDWGENIYIAAVLYAIWFLDRHRRSRVVCVVIAAICVTLPIEGVKRIVGRERPDLANGLLVVHGWSAQSDKGDFQSFPSGHTAAAASYSGSLSAFYPPLTPMCVFLAAGCGANRIWKERHFFSDCLVGGVFGFWFSYTLPRRRWIRPFLDLFDRWFSIPDDRHVHGLDLAPPRAA